MAIEAVLLTGGASRRMGEDKALLTIDGQPLVERIAARLAGRASRVTVLGRHPLPGYLFQPDLEEYAGPLSALARFQPVEPLVFVTSCDLPLFDASVIDDLVQIVGARDGAVPVSEGRPQPLCALYRATAFVPAERLFSTGERRLMRWLDELDVALVDEASLSNPTAVRSANTPEELRSILRQ